MPKPSLENYSSDTLQPITEGEGIKGFIPFPKNISLKVLYHWFNKGIPQVQAEELASLSESD